MLRDRYGGNVCRDIDQLQMTFAGEARLAEVHGKGPQYTPVRIEDGSGPTGPQIILEGHSAIIVP